MTKSSSALKKEIAETKKRIKYLRNEIGRMMTDDEWAKNEGSDVMNRVLAAWPVAAQWLEHIKTSGRANNMVLSPNGRRRHLPAYLHASNKVKSAMNRRGPNSVVQGFSSEVGCIASFLIDKFIWDVFESQGLPLEAGLENMVHDSAGRSCRLELVPVVIYLLEHGMTTMVRDFYRDVFGFDMKSVPYFDVDIGLRDDIMTKWETQRFDELEHILRDVAKQMDAPSAMIKAMLHNFEVIKKLREAELRTDPFKMSKNAASSKWWKTNIKWPIDTAPKSGKRHADTYEALAA